MVGPKPTLEHCAGRNLAYLSLRQLRDADLRASHPDDDVVCLHGHALLCLDEFEQQFCIFSHFLCRE